MTTSQNSADYASAYGTPLGYNNGNSGPLAITDFSRAFCQQWTLTASCLLGQPINPPPKWTRVLLQFTQDGSGSRVLTYASCFRDGPSLGSSGAAGSSALLEFLYDGASYQYAGGSSGWNGAGTQIIPGVGAAVYVGSQPVAPRVITPTVGAAALGGVAPGVGRNQKILIPGPGGLLVDGKYPAPTRP